MNAAKDNAGSVPLIGPILGRTLLLLEALGRVYPPIKECVRGCWNTFAAEHNQCPPRCPWLCSEPESDDEEDLGDPPEPEVGFALRGDVEIEVWAELRPRMMEWCASHSADVDEGRLVEPFTTDEQARQSRSLFSGDRPPPSDGELPGL